LRLSDLHQSSFLFGSSRLKPALKVVGWWDDAIAALLDAPTKLVIARR